MRSGSPAGVSRPGRCQTRPAPRAPYDTTGGTVSRVSSATHGQRNTDGMNQMPRPHDFSETSPSPTSTRRWSLSKLRAPVQLRHGRREPARGQRRLVVGDVGALDGVDPVPERLQHGGPPALQRLGGAVEVVLRLHTGDGGVGRQQPELLQVGLGHRGVGVPERGELLERVTRAGRRRRRPHVGEPVRVRGPA